MDAGTTHSITAFVTGVILPIVGAYITMRVKGKSLYSDEKVKRGCEKIKSLAKENEVLWVIAAALGNVSPDEAADIFNTAMTYAEDGKISKAEAEALGLKVYYAVQTRQDGV